VLDNHVLTFATDVQQGETQRGSKQGKSLIWVTAYVGVCVCETYCMWNPVQLHQHQYYKILSCLTSHISIPPFGFYSPPIIFDPKSHILIYSPWFMRKLSALWTRSWWAEVLFQRLLLSMAQCPIRHFVSHTMQSVVDVGDPGVWRVVCRSFAVVSNEASYQTDETVMDEMSLQLSPLCTLITIYHH